MSKAVIKFNGGRLAILCSKCHKILKTGKDFTDAERKYVKSEVQLPAQYCVNCKSENDKK